MTRQIARMLRRNPSRPEREAWALLRELRKEGVAVRRQHPVGRYVTDFAIMRARIAIEIDGPLHAQQREADALRDAAFAQLGWRVLRFTPEHVADSVRFLADIRAALPSPRGEGAGGGVSLDACGEHTTQAPIAANAPHPPAPRPPPLAGRGSDGALDDAIPLHLRRRTRANRKPKSAP